MAGYDNEGAYELSRLYQTIHCDHEVRVIFALLAHGVRGLSASWCASACPWRLFSACTTLLRDPGIPRLLWQTTWELMEFAFVHPWASDFKSPEAVR